MINPFDPKDTIFSKQEKEKKLYDLRVSISEFLNSDSPIEDVQAMGKLAIEYLDWLINHPRLVYFHTQMYRIELAKKILETSHYFNDVIDQSKYCEATVEVQPEVINLAPDNKKVH